ncbi:MAG: hypothetical protein KGZ97_00610 [Bacteroidetes bacterium]|nr:hypothetical protein [Bacteroidota bacterium]
MSRFKLIIILTILFTSCRHVNNRDQFTQSFDIDSILTCNIITDVDFENVQDLADFVSNKPLI